MVWTEWGQVTWWLLGKDCPAGAAQAEAVTAAWVEQQGFGPAVGLEEVELAAVGPEVVLAAAGPVEGGWQCARAGIGGAGIAAGDE